MGRTTFDRLHPTLAQLPGQPVDWMFDFCGRRQSQNIKHANNIMRSTSSLVRIIFYASGNYIYNYIHIPPGFLGPFSVSQGFLGRCSARWGMRRAPESSNPFTCRGVRTLKSVSVASAGRPCKRRAPPPRGTILKDSLFYLC